MTIYKQTFEGGTVGDKVTTTNSGTGGSTAYSVVTQTETDVVILRYDSTRAAAGSKSGKITQAGAGQAFGSYTLPGSTSASEKISVYLPIQPTADLPLLYIGVGTTRKVQVNVNSAGKLRVVDVNGGTGIWTATNVIPLNQFVRIEIWAKPGTSTTNGYVQVAYFVGEGTTPVETATITTANTGVDPFTNTRGGRFVSGTTYASDMWVDNHVVNDAATAMPGPEASAPPIAVLAGAARYRLDGTGSSGSAPLTYSIAQTDGEVTVPQNISPGLWLVTQSQTDNLIYELTVTDGNGLTNTSTHTVPRASAGTDPVEEVIWNGTAWV